jgi:26S proteasome regulatory subunit N5
MSAQKMEQDFTPLVEEKIPENRKLALEKKNLAQAIENLLVIEKQTRNGGDAPSTGKILSTIVELCYETKDFKALNENIVLLSKRRGQLKQVRNYSASKKFKSGKLTSTHAPIICKILMHIILGY